MSYRIVRQTIRGQRRQIIANGVLGYAVACDVKAELDEEMFKVCEVLAGIPQEEHVIEED